MAVLERSGYAEDREVPSGRIREGDNHRRRSVLAQPDGGREQVS